MFNSLFKPFKLYFLQKKWRRKNSNNKTGITSNVDPDLVTIGKETYGVINVINHSGKYRLIIGSYCSIAPEVMFIVCGDHQTNTFSTYPFKVAFCHEKCEASSKGDIVIGDDVWICYRSTILSGVKIGRGAIVMAGSVVTKDVEPYSIVGGVPARTIRKRFSDDQIKILMSIDYEKIKPETIKNNLNLFYSIIPENDTEILKQIATIIP